MGFDFSNASDSTDLLGYFSERGEDYEQYRPIYPAATVDAILSGLASPEQLAAADIGAGIGIGSRLLAERGVQVIAIEPNANMRTAATPHKRVQFLAGTAEQTRLETASVDLVTSFQAFHWFDFDNSLQEFRRILRLGGRLALTWSFWEQRDATSQEYSRLVFAASQDWEGRSHPKNWLRSLRYQLFRQG